MCTVCGCGAGEVKIEGGAHEHTHVHEDGTVHTHAHDHADEHDHSHDDAPLGVRPSLFRRSGFATAAERACQQHALRCEKEPLILDLRPTLEAAVSDSRRAVFLSPVIGFVGWAIPRLLLDFYRLLAALLTTLRTAWFHNARPTKS